MPDPTPPSDPPRRVYCSVALFAVFRTIILLALVLGLVIVIIYSASTDQALLGVGAIATALGVAVKSMFPEGRHDHDADNVENPREGRVRSRGT